MKKAVFLVFLALVVVAGIFILRNSSDVRGGRVLNAKVRYFDGTCEMIEISRFYHSGTLVQLDTVSGDRIYIGPNNVIIIDEEEPGR